MSAFTENLMFLMFGVSCLILAVAGARLMLRKASVTHSITVGKETESGETLQMAVQITAEDSDIDVRLKLEKLWAIGDDRRRFLFERMQKLIAEEEAKQIAESKAEAEEKAAQAPTTH